MFANSRGVQIYGGSYTVNTSTGEGSDTQAESLRILKSGMHFGATYDADVRSDVPKCHEGTRIAIVERLKSWAQASALGNSFMWIYGPAGSGKTTIQQTMAEIFFESGALAASFFFSRSAEARPRVKTQFVMSLAYQLWFSIPDTRPHIVQALIQDPALGSKNLQKQMDALLIGPLNRLAQSPPSSASIFIVDGLDECEGDEAQWEVLQLLERLSAAKYPLCILVASRPEHIIRTFFSQKHIATRTSSMPLDNDYQTRRDIETFLLSEFRAIREKHPAGANLPADWPSGSDVHCLLERSSGQFIYASVVMRYIAEPIRHPKTSLRNIITVASGDITPFRQLDALYTHVLSSIEEDNVPRVMDILGWLVLDVTTRLGGYRFNGDRRRGAGNSSQSGMGRRSLKTLKTLDLISTEDSGTTRTQLLRLNSLMNIPDGDAIALSFYHQSFSDFLLDKSRSKSFFVDLREVHHNFALQWIRFYAQHLKMHHACHDEPVHHCRVVIGNSSLDVISAIIFHSIRGEFSQLLATELLELDITAALALSYRIEGDDWWMTITCLINFCVWLREQPTTSVPYSIHDQLFQNVKRAITSCLSATFSPLDQHRAAVFISCLDEYDVRDTTVLLLSDIVPVAEQRLMKAILMTLGASLEMYLVPSERGTTHLMNDPSDWVLYDSSQVLLCKALSDLPMTGKAFEDKFCYTEYATHIMEGITACWESPNRHLARAAPLDSITEITWRFLRVHLTRAEPDTRLATLLRDHCLQVKGRNIWIRMRLFTLAAIIFMHESKVPYVNRWHLHDCHQNSERTCGICDILQSDFLAECELSSNPLGKSPNEEDQDARAALLPIRGDLARQFIPFVLFLEMLLTYLAGLINRFRL